MENTIAQNTNAGATWIRLPRAGDACPHTGLKRGQLLKLACDKRNGLKVCHLREQGAKRGTRLIELHSLLDFLEAKAGGLS
jgi:hypothetical protein